MTLVGRVNNLFFNTTQIHKFINWEIFALLSRCKPIFFHALRNWKYSSLINQQTIWEIKCYFNVFCKVFFFCNNAGLPIHQFQALKSQGGDTHFSRRTLGGMRICIFAAEGGTNICRDVFFPFALVPLKINNESVGTGH